MGISGDFQSRGKVTHPKMGETGNKETVQGQPKRGRIGSAVDLIVRIFSCLNIFSLCERLFRGKGHVAEAARGQEQDSAPKTRQFQHIQSSWAQSSGASEGDKKFDKEFRKNFSGSPTRAGFTPGVRSSSDLHFGVRTEARLHEMQLKAFEYQDGLEHQLQDVSLELKAAKSQMQNLQKEHRKVQKELDTAKLQLNSKGAGFARDGRLDGYHSDLEQEKTKSAGYAQQVQLLEKQHEKAQNKLLKQIENLEQDLGGRTEELQALEGKCERLEKALRESSPECVILTQVTVDAEKLAALEQELSKAKLAAEGYWTEATLQQHLAMDVSAKYHNLQQGYEEKLAECDGLSEQVAALSKQVGDTTQLKAAREQAARFQGEVQRIQAVLEAKQAEVETLSSESSLMKGERDQWQKECSVLQQAKGTAQASLAQAQEQILMLEGLINKSTQELGQGQEKIQSLAQHNEKVQAQLVEIQGAVTEKEEALAKAQEQYTQAQKDLETIRDQLEKAMQNQQNEYTAQKTALEKSLEERDGQIRTLSQKLEDVTAELESAQETLKYPPTGGINMLPSSEEELGDVEDVSLRRNVLVHSFTPSFSMGKYAAQQQQQALLDEVDTLMEEKAALEQALLQEKRLNALVQKQVEKSVQEQALQDSATQQLEYWKESGTQAMADYARAQEQVTALQSKLEKLSQDESTIKQNYTEDVTKLETEKQDLKGKNEVLQGQIAQLQQKLQDAVSQQKEAEEASADLRSVFGTRIQAQKAEFAKETSELKSENQALRDLLSRVLETQELSDGRSLLLNSQRFSIPAY